VSVAPPPFFFFFLPFLLPILYQFDDDDGAHGIDYRIVSAQPHFQDANHLLLKQALLDPDLTKCSVFVTPHRQLALQLKKAGAALVMNPVHWMDHVMAAHGKTGSVDLMQFMKEFANANASPLGLAKPTAEQVKLNPKAAADDPYFAYRYRLKGGFHNGLPDGFVDPDWHDKGNIKYNYRPGEAPAKPDEVRARDEVVAKQKAILEQKRRELVQSLAATVASTTTETATAATAAASLPEQELAAYLTTMRDPQLQAPIRDVLQVAALTPHLAPHKTAASLLQALATTKPGEAWVTNLQTSLDQFFVLRLADRAPTLWSTLTEQTQPPLELADPEAAHVRTFSLVAGFH
jgi:hypothetical protein